MSVPTLEEVLALPYGVSGSHPAPSLSDLLALDYTGSTAFTNGMTSADFRAQHRAQGREFRYWDALTAPGTNRSEKVYVEAVIPDGERGLFYNSKTAVTSEKYGLFPAGSTLFSCLPDVCEITDGGYLLDSSPAQWQTGQASITRGLTDTDALTEKFVRQILKVMVAGVAVPLEQVEAVSADSPDEADTGGLRWLSGAPDEGTKYFVLFQYSRLYTCLGESLQGEPTGSDGLRLPQRVLLRKDKQ